MKHRRTRVLLIHSIPTPYRVPLFRRLAEDPDFELRVLFMSGSASNRVWQEETLGLTGSRVLPGFTINVRWGGDTFPIWVNPTVPLEIIAGNFDVVICAGWDSITTFLARLACLVTRTRFILWAGSTSQERSWRRSVMMGPVRLLVRSAHACLAYGTAAKSYLESCGAKRVFVSYNTVDVHAFEENTRQLDKVRDLLKQQLGIQAEHVVLYVGQFIQRKGVLTLANSLNLLDHNLDVAMVWVGYGMLRGHIEQIAEHNASIKHFFFSAQTAEELYQFYAVADVSILPSREEVWGLVVNESLASGVPVITTSAVGSAQDLIRDDRNGFVVSPDDERSIADRIACVFGHPGGREYWSRSARLSMQNYTYEQNARAFRDAIAAVVR